MSTATQTRPSPARERILATAFSLFYAKGIRAVGIDLIIAESGVAKATFYKHFPAKDDLVVAYLDKVDGVWTGQLKAAAEAAGPDPARPARRHVRRTEERLPPGGLPRLCFINAAAESQPGTAVHNRTVTHKAAVLDWVHDLAEAAGARDPGALARSLTLLLDGGLASGSLDASPEAPEVAKATAGALVAAATRCEYFFRLVLSGLAAR